jgi:cyclic pyranopterin phosphate synthase
MSAKRAVARGAKRAAARGAKRRTLSHVDDGGRARMVDVGGKPVTRRRAVARGHIRMSRECFRLVRANRVAKGDVLRVAEVAGIAAAKRTSDLIPLCHPLPLDKVSVSCTLDARLPGVRVSCEARVEARTGVEMEALTACAVTLLTVYDMCKAADPSMEIGGIIVTAKSGGRGPDREVSPGS